MVPVRINDAITIPFVLDSGAGDISVPEDVSGTAPTDEPLKVFEQRVIDSLLSTSKRQTGDACTFGINEACKNLRNWAEHDAKERARWFKTVDVLTPTERNCLKQVGYKTFQSHNDPIEGDVPEECKIRIAKRGAAEMYYSLAHLTYYNAEATRCWNSGGILRDWQCRPRS
jgi:hypothetical protein